MPVTNQTHGSAIIATLDALYERADAMWERYINDQPLQSGLDDDLTALLDAFWNIAINADSKTIVTNLTTCLACKAVHPQVDCRHHRQDTKGMPSPANGTTYFSGRTISEGTVVPWLKDRSFFTANSGWQTRTFERLRPYTLDYPENIAHAKSEFLSILDKVQSGRADLASDALAYLILKQIEHREDHIVRLTEPSIRDINAIVDLFDRHFNFPYSHKGAARLPVLALYAVYTCLVSQVQRYSGKTLSPLERHEAADTQTGATGDIEIVDEEGDVFEGLEIKHGVTVDSGIIQASHEKFRDRPSIDRYYILTTAEPCGGTDDDSVRLLSRIHAAHGVDIQINGVLPTIRYFLRLLTDPAAVFPIYVDLLHTDDAITYEHLEAWNQVVIGDNS